MKPNSDVIEAIKEDFHKACNDVDTQGCLIPPKTFDYLVDEYKSYYPYKNIFDLDDMEDAISEARSLQFNEEGSSSNIARIKFALQCVSNFFKDPRQSTKVIYPMHSVILIILLARARGIKHFVDIADFYARYNIVLQLLIPDLPPPSELIKPSTINTIRALVSSQDIDFFFSAFFGAMKLSLGDLVTYNDDKYKLDRDGLMDTWGFDGQELRSSYKKGEANRSKKGAIAVTLMNCSLRTAISFVNTSLKNHERSAFLDLVTSFDLSGKVIMCDALNSSAEVTSAIVAKGGVYLMPIKRNQGNKELCEHIEAVFNREHSKAQSCEFTFKDHSRIEHSVIEILPATRLDKRIKNPHQQVLTIVKYTKHVVSSGTSESRFYISNLAYNTSDTLRQVKASITDYWMIETHHNILDTSRLAQDNFQGCNPNTLSMEVAINKIVYNMCTLLRNEMSVARGKKTPVSYETTMQRMSSMKVSRLLAYIVGKFFMESYKPIYENSGPDMFLEKMKAFHDNSVT